MHYHAKAITIDELIQILSDLHMDGEGDKIVFDGMGYPIEKVERYTRYYDDGYEEEGFKID